jgi:hypothetical protein
MKQHTLYIYAGKVPSLVSKDIKCWRNERNLNLDYGHKECLKKGWAFSPITLIEKPLCLPSSLSLWNFVTSPLYQNGHFILQLVCIIQHFYNIPIYFKWNLMSTLSSTFLVFVLLRIFFFCFKSEEIQLSVKPTLWIHSYRIIVSSCNRWKQLWRLPPPLMLSTNKLPTFSIQLLLWLVLVQKMFL